jgi:hypothetical protein
MEISTIISGLGLLFAILTSYFSSRMKLIKFQTETNMKFAELERRFTEHVDGNKNEFSDLWKDNKEDHIAITNNLKDVAKTLNEVKLEIAKKL